MELSDKIDESTSKRCQRPEAIYGIPWEDAHYALFSIMKEFLKRLELQNSLNSG